MRARAHGFVLVMTMMMILVLTGVGLIALRSARLELGMASNSKLATQAEYVAEAGLLFAVLAAGSNPNLYDRKAMQGGASGYTFPHYSTVFYETIWDSGDPNEKLKWDVFGLRATARPDFRVTMNRGIDVTGLMLPGFQLSGAGAGVARLRFKRYDFVATGRVVQERYRTDTGVIERTGLAVGDALTDFQIASTRVKAQVVLGPL